MAEQRAFKIYNGHRYIFCSPQLQQVGHKLGDFAGTRKRCRRNRKPEAKRKR